MMDRSRIYVKQSNCPEVQGRWKPKNWKSYTVWHTRLKTLGDIIYGRDWEHSEGELIWLPRQDEIQKMLVKDSINIELNKFYVFCLEKAYVESLLPTVIFNSFEQLWLAFYMWEKHKKIWNGEKWT